jgi:hypothetical protein
MKNRKILVAGGDSFTEHTRVSYCDSSLVTDFPRWSAKLAEKLDMEYVNLGKSACNNHYISTSVFEYLIENPKKEIGLVCCLWGEYTRLSLYNMPNWPTMMGSRLFSPSLKQAFTYTHFAPPYNESFWREGPDKFLDLLYYYAKNTNTKAETIVEKIIKDNIKLFHDLECMLSLRNIPYLYLQGVFPFSDTAEFRYLVREKISPNLLKNRGLEKIYAPPIKQLIFYLLKYEKYLKNKEKFIGWPGFKSGGGHGIIFDKKEAAEYFISKEDLHPNEKGHQIIATVFYEKTKELYPYLL